MGKGKQLSPYLEQCCLRSSANVSYANAAQDVAMLTGISVSAKTQQRLVQGYEFPAPIATTQAPMQEACVDGGKVRIRTPLGEPSSWRDDKAIETNAGIVANFRNNAELIEWVKQQPLVFCQEFFDGLQTLKKHTSHPSQLWVTHQLKVDRLLAPIITCLGDGHDGVWNIVAEIATAEQRREILDWYHLIENLHKIGGSKKRLEQAETLLWKGNVETTIALLGELKCKQAKNFCQYLEKHRDRIVNYA